MAGGVGFYIRNNLEYQVIQEFDLTLPNCEDLWIETRLNSNNQSLVIGVIYKHPKCSTPSFTKAMAGVFEKLAVAKKKFVLLGDFNINLLDTCDNSTTNYFNMLISHFVMPVITKPTRVTPSSHTLIDHIYTNTINLLSSTFILLSDITDHFPVMCTISGMNVGPKTKIKMRRDMKNFCSDSFRSEIESMCDNYMGVSLTKENFNLSLDSFIGHLKWLINKHAPLRPLSRKENKLFSKPWITRGIRRSIRHKNNMFKKMYLQGNLNQRAHFKKYKNILTRLQRKSKQLYYQNVLENNRGDVKRTWKTINDIIKIKFRDDISILELKLENGTSVSDPVLVASEFNKFFSTVGERLARKISQSSNTITDFLGVPLGNSFYLESTSTTEILQIISNLKKGKAVGPDGIPSHFLKIVADIISPALSHFFNSSFRLGIFPSSLKIARVIPIFKNGKRNDPSNYRPISILPAIGIILEKLLYKRMINFCSKFNLIDKCQFGFQTKHSTNHAILDLISSIYDKLDKGEFVCCTFLDLKKAFDTVDHHILSHKLRHYGFRGVSGNLLTDYLSCRYQYVEVNSHKSPMLPIQYGIPQGSVLGPLGFLLFINDLSNSSNFLTKLFADDACLLDSAKDLITLQAKVNTGINKVYELMICNKLTVNVEKSKVMLFSPKSRTRNSSLSIKINGIPLEIVQSYRYLGLHIDHQLKWNSHITEMYKKLSRSVGILGKLKYYVPSPTLRTIYFALFQSHIQYALAAWGSATQTSLRKLEILQNRAVKILSGAPVRSNINTLYHKARVLKLSDIYKLEISKIMHQFHNNQLPAAFADYFTALSNVHEHNTRSSTKSNFFVPRFSLSKSQNSLKYKGVVIWNSIPQILRDSSYETFKTKYKKFLLSPYQSAVIASK